MKQIQILLLLSLGSAALYCDIDSPLHALKIGNFYNNRSPSSNFSFGQNIVTKRSLALYTYFYQLKGEQQNDIEIIFQAIYGISRKSSILIYIPCIAKLKAGDLHGKGIGDIAIQGEYAWYTKISPTFRSQSTIVANITVPSARISPDRQLEKVPPGGSGAVTFFLGGTLSHTSEKWYAFISDGGIITLKDHHGNKAGNSLLYQGGFGRFLGTPWGITATFIFEIDGTLAQKNKTCAGYDANSGGNTIFMGPTLSLSGDVWAFQGGIEFPALQHLNGIQNKQHFVTLLSLSYQFS